MLKSHNLQNRISKLSIGLGSLHFSERIARKYSIFRRSGRLFSLIFYRLFGEKNAIKKINIYHKGSINNNIRFHFSVYLKVARQWIKTPNYHLQKLDNLKNSSNLQPEINTLSTQNIQTMENFILGNEAPRFSFVFKKIYFFRTPKQVMDFKKNPTYSVQLPRSMNLDVQPQKFLQFSGNFVPSIHEKYPGRLQRLLYYIRSKSQKKVPIMQHSRVIKNIGYENLSKDATGKNILFHTSYLRTGSANIDLNYINPINVSYLQRIFKVEKAGSEINRVIHFQPPGIRILDKQGSSSGLPQITTMNEHLANSIAITRRITNPLLHYSRNLSKDATGKNILFPASYLRTGSANVGLNYITPINVNYLQRTSNVEKAGSEINRVIHFQPPGIRILDKQGSSSGLPPITTMNGHLGNSIAIIRRITNPLLQYSRVIKNIDYDSLSKNAAGKNILFPASYLRTGSANVDLNYISPININYLQTTSNVEKAGSEINRVIHFQLPGMQTLDKTGSSSGLPPITTMNEHLGNSIAIIRRITNPLLQYSRGIKNIGYENLSKAETGKNIPVSYSRFWSANVDLNYMNPINIRNLHRAFNVERASSEAGRVIHFQPQKSDKEKLSFGLPHIKIMKEHLANRIAIIEKTIDPLLHPRIFSGMVFHRQGVSFQQGDHIMKKRRSVDPGDDTGYVNNTPKELVLKKPSAQSTDFVSEYKEQLHTDKMIRTNIGDNLIKEPLKENQIYEMNKIADMVYKMIERRISIEKDRRGLF